MDNERISKLFERQQLDVSGGEVDERPRGGLFDVGGRAKVVTGDDRALNAIQRSFISTPEPAPRQAAPENETKSIFDLAAEQQRNHRMDTLEEELARTSDEREEVNLKVGERVRDYRVLSVLGEGGMGTVFLAQHTMLGHKVSIKMLLPQFSDDQQYVKRLFLEAKVMMEVKHPSIVEVYDFGYHTNGSAFLVMEYLDGESLEERYENRGKASVAEALHITREVANGLLIAHERGIIHRDLKPDNVFLIRDPRQTDQSRVKILDFGLAKVTNNGMGSLVHTRAGSLMGTPAYMSPEQCRGTGNIDFRTDIYSLGCVLFRLITGRPPFIGDTPADVLACHLREPAPSLRDFEPQVSLELAAMVQGALAKDPNDRYSTLEEFVNSIQAVEMTYAAGRPIVIPPPRPRSERSRNIPVVADAAPSESATGVPPAVAKETAAPAPALAPADIRQRAATPVIDAGDGLASVADAALESTDAIRPAHVRDKGAGHNRTVLIAVVIIVALVAVGAVIFGLL